MIEGYVMDASALLAVLFNEPGAEAVWAVLDESRIHAVNLAEAARKMVGAGMPPAEVESRLDGLHLDIITNLEPDQALAVGKLGLEARRLGLSLGDSVCLIVAGAIGAFAVTADRRWSEVQGLRTQVLQIR